MENCADREKIIMKSTELIKTFELSEIEWSEKSKEITEIFNGERRRLIQVNLRGGAVLSKHNAREPITVLCLKGNCWFRAGSDLEDERKLVAGTLIILESGVEHEVAAAPEISLLVTKFKAE